MFDNRASVATIARIPYAKQLLSNPDYLYNFTDLAIWSIVECGIAITASSLATLRPLFIKMKLLATSHLTARYGHSRYGSAGLPIQSAKTITVISSRARSSKRHTAMTGSTGYTGVTASTAVTAATSGLMSVKEAKEGIQVEKEFEMSIITREPSQDSIDRLEAEVNEVISPGSARRKPSHDQFSFPSPSRSSSGRTQSRPPPLQTSFRGSSSASPSTPVHVSAGSSSSSGHRFMGQAPTSNPPSPQPQRRPLEGRMRSASYDRSPRSTQHPPRPPYGEIGSAYTADTTTTPRSPLLSHQHTVSDGTIRAAPAGVSFAPPNFHLPMRGPHQSVVSNHSDFSLNEFRATPVDEAGLSAPPRIFQMSHGDYAPRSSAPSPLGSPVSSSGRPNRSLGGSPVSSQPHGSPAPTTSMRFPFHRQDTIQELPDGARSQRGKQRVSACLAGAEESLYSSAEGLEQRLEEGVHTPRWSPPRHEMPSPLRSHPPASPHGGWL